MLKKLSNSDQEFGNAEQQYFPQPGDSQEVIAQKRANRENAVKGFEIGAGNAIQHPVVQDSLSQKPQYTLEQINQMTPEQAAKLLAEMGG